MTTFELTSKQVTDLHNAMCSLRSMRDDIVTNYRDESPMVKGINYAFKLLEPIRKQLMDIKDAEQNRKYNMYKQVGENNGIKHSIWSMYEVEDLADQSPIPPGTLLESYHTDKRVRVAGSTWLDLWRAADELVCDANDTHVFIEGFKLRGNTCEVTLGS